MAEFKDVFEKISQMLECGICMSQLNDPKALSCNHSYCKNCLDNLLVFDVDGSATIECPLRCEGKSYIPADQTTEQLGMLYQFKGIIDMCKDNQGKPIATEGIYFCHGCENVVSIYCFDCGNFFCKPCHNNHKSHSTIVISYSETHGKYLPVCKEHNALAVHVCCKEIICVYCKSRKHRGHHHEIFKDHAERIKRLFFETDGCQKIERIMTNAKSNYEKTKSDVLDLKRALMDILKERMNTYISKQISLVKEEVLRTRLQLDDIISHHLNDRYPNVEPCEYLTSVPMRDDLELILKEDVILKEYSRFTTPVPTLTISVGNPGSPYPHSLGELNVKAGEYVSIGDDKRLSTVVNMISDSTVVHDVSFLVNKLNDLMEEVDTTIPSSYSQDLSPYSVDKPYVKTDEKKPLTKSINQTLKQVIGMIDKRGYEYLDELFGSGEEQLIIDVITERNDIAHLRDRIGVTLLHSASQYGFDKLINFILKSKFIDVNVKQKYCQTPLHYAAFHNKRLAVENLLKYNADVEIKNHKGNRPIDVAKQYNSTHALLVLTKI